MSDKKINLVINGKNNSGPALTSAQKALGALETAAVRLGPLVVGALGARAIKEAADLWIRQEDAIKQVESRLISTRGVSGQTSAGLQAMASSLQGVTKYGDEATLEMQSLLLTFTQIQGPVFGQATEAIMNVATAMKRDLSSAALQVGKALNDPILGVSALAESGIQFTQSQKSVIKALVDTGDVAGAQKIILGELEVQFGGAARAAREGMGGSVTAMGNAFSDVMEQLGRGAANGGAVGLFDSISTRPSKT
jgi:phage-related minor tail protein